MTKRGRSSGGGGGGRGKRGGCRQRMSLADARAEEEGSVAPESFLAAWLV